MQVPLINKPSPSIADTFTSLLIYDLAVLLAVLIALRPFFACTGGVQRKALCTHHSGGKLATYAARSQYFFMDSLDHVRRPCSASAWLSFSCHKCRISCHGWDQSTPAGGPTTCRIRRRKATSTLCSESLYGFQTPAPKHATDVTSNQSNKVGWQRSSGSDRLDNGYNQQRNQPDNGYAQQSNQLGNGYRG